MGPAYEAAQSFVLAETEREPQTLLDTAENHLAIAKSNAELFNKAVVGTQKAFGDYWSRIFNEGIQSLQRTLSGNNGGENFEQFMDRQVRTLETVVEKYPKAVKDIEPLYGFHFDNGGYCLEAETDRFYLYQVLRTNGERVDDWGRKPILIVNPIVLDANILALLPPRHSYVHQYANAGTPTYVRILKDIQKHPAVQVMTGEDDVLDTQFFCQKLLAKHNRMVTLNGVCQGGLMTLMGVLSGKLDGLVDALITCVAPIDGTRGSNITEYVETVSDRFRRDLLNATKILSNGNRVINGKILSWVYRLSDIEKQVPLALFHQALINFGSLLPDGNLPMTQVATSRWMEYDRVDLAPKIVKYSLDTFSKPITANGTMPVSLFGKPLNIKRINEKRIRCLICIAEKDTLVPREVTTAPLDFVKAELTVFPGGHVARLVKEGLEPISGPDPVKFHLDMEKAAQ